MHPAFSVVFLTTLLGVGQGLFTALFVALLGAELEFLPAMDRVGFHAVGAALALGFLGLGLIASVFHLGRPERGWRAAARWRTSWLSREVIVLPAFMAVVFVYAVGMYFGWPGMVELAAVGVVLSLALFICTGMIYACVKFLQEWHSPLTVINYILLGLASGFTAATGLAAFTGTANVGFLGVWAVTLTFAALLTRGASLIRNARLKPKSTLQTAIGVRHSRIVQKSQGFMGGSFNTREFFHGRSAGLLRNLKWVFLILVFPVPVALLLAGMAGPAVWALGAAFIVQYLGLLVERWFFFAQANHPQNLYYQTVS
ncbi:MAG: dimethyl sulfoxide reductase anchor subunit family protein [Pseudomonadota bacterium]